MPGLVADPRVAAVSLTGPEFAGEEVASQAGRHLKKVVLELGGSDPFIVMPSADLDAAVATGVKSRVINNGQSCIAAKRFIVADAVGDAFTERFVARMEALRVGDPLDPATELGPLARASGREGLHDQVTRSVAAGARLLTGGDAAGRPGLLLSTDCARRRAGERPRLLRRAVRPGGDDLSRAGRRRRDRPGQRHALRPGLQRVDARGRGDGPLRRARSRRGRCSSTAWSRPTRGCRSVGPSARATAASSAPGAFASSSTSRPYPSPAARSLRAART